MPMEREQFTFYSSFAKAIRRIKKAPDRCLAYDILVAYALEGKEPDLDSLPESVAMFFDLTRPVLDTAARKSKGGKTQARPKEDNGKTPASKRKDSGKEKEKEKEEEAEKEKEIEGENECSIPPVVPPLPETPPEPLIVEQVEFGGELGQAFAEWIAYKRERRETYGETGYKVLVTQIRNAAARHGDAAVVEVIRNSIASRYQGITLDRLDKKAASGGAKNRYDWMDKVVLD